MWTNACPNLFKQAFISAACGSRPGFSFRFTSHCTGLMGPSILRFCSSTVIGGGSKKSGGNENTMTYTEEKEVITYKELLNVCESLGVAKSTTEAVALARVLNEAGFVVLFRDKLYLHPDKVVNLVKRTVPLALLPEDEPCMDELKNLQEKKEENDMLAHKQVCRNLCTCDV